MDAPDCDRETLEAALRALARVNRAFGALSPVWRGVQRALANRRPGPIRILDVGTGSGDIPRRLFRRLEARGWQPEFVLADLHPTTLGLARRWTEAWARGPGAVPRARFSYLRTTATRLPLADDSVDLVFATTMLHHLEREEVAAFLREADRVSRVGWIVTDLRRSRVTAVAVRLLAETVWRRNPYPREDGPISVRRSFLPAEVREIARGAGLKRVEVGSAGPFHLVAAGGALCRA